MKSLTMKFLALALFVLATSTTVFSQAVAGAVTVKGHVTDPAGMTVTKGEIRFTKDKTVAPKDAKMTNATPIDANGNYEAKDIAPGDYFVYVFQDGTTTDRQELNVKPAQNVTLDFDMTSARYMKDIPDDRKKEIEEYKKRAAAAASVNSVINNLNKTLTGVRTDLAAAAPAKADVSKDVADMKSATDAKPDESVLWTVYGEALLAQADHLAAEDQKSGKAFLSDDSTVKMYTDAAAAYQKGIDLNAASKKPTPADQAVGFNSIGNIEGKLGKVPEASAAYDSAVKQDPTKAGMYYGNESITLYKAGQSDGAAAAADKAIAADPTNPIIYYIKGQALVGKATLDPKTNLYILPPGCVDAYKKFIELEPPSDPKVAEVQSVLAALNVKVETTYKAPSSKKK